MEQDDMKSDIPLPDELLAEIISHFIPLSQWSRCLECVSRQFQRCVLVAYGRIKTMNCRKLFSLKKFKSYKYPGNIQYNNIFEKLLTVCPNVADIVGFNSYALYRYRLSLSCDILGQFDRLQSISLIFIGIVEFRPFADFVANSKSLKILKVRCDFDSGGTLNVGSLSVVEYDYPEQKISLENLSEKLTALAVNSLEKSFKEDRDAMKHCRNLERFSVSLYTTNDYEIFLSNLPSLCKLTSLQISTSRTLNPNLFNEKFCGHLNFLKNQLRSIEFHDVIVSEEVQNFLLTECLQLQTLILRERSGFYSNSIKNVRRLPANLKTLTFQDYNAGALTILLPNLVQLMNLTDLSISDSFCTDWKKWENICCLLNLQNLHLCNESVNDALVQAWHSKSPEMFKKLVTFKLPCCPHISDIGGVLIASKARNLKQLDLVNSRISEKTIFVLADCAKNLVETDLSQRLPLLFDEKAVISLIEKAKRLKKVKVSGRLAEKLIENENFHPLGENVEIESNILD